MRGAIGVSGAVSCVLCSRRSVPTDEGLRLLIFRASSWPSSSDDDDPDGNDPDSDDPDAEQETRRVFEWAVPLQLVEM